MAQIRSWGLLAMLLLMATPSLADVFRPAYLELSEVDPQQYDVLWKVPARGNNSRLSVYVEFPAGTERLTEPRAVIVGNAWIERFSVHRDGGFAGETIEIRGNAVGMTDVIARIQRLDGSSQVERLPLDSPRFVVQPAQGRGQIAWSYLVLGVEHILSGVDHLLFVLALLLIVRGSWRILGTVTAFTVAHSLTLAPAALGLVRVPGPPVEAFIALSIMFVAAEVIHGLQGRPGITARAPWVVAFSFGLLHGLGFAGALAEIGLPQVAIPLALFMFNVGVELGQLLFIAAVLSVWYVVDRIAGARPAWLTAAAAYAIGSVAAYWTLERIVGFGA